jgi:hypothetical protein
MGAMFLFPKNKITSESSILLPKNDSRITIKTAKRTIMAITRGKSRLKTLLVFVNLPPLNPCEP